MFYLVRCAVLFAPIFLFSFLFPLNGVADPGLEDVYQEFFKKVVNHESRYVLYRLSLSDGSNTPYDAIEDVDPTGCEISLVGQPGGREADEWAIQGQSFWNPFTRRFYLYTFETNDKQHSLHVIYIETMQSPSGPVTQCHLVRSFWNIGTQDDPYSDDVMYGGGAPTRTVPVRLVDGDFNPIQAPVPGGKGMGRDYPTPLP